MFKMNADTKPLTQDQKRALARNFIMNEAARQHDIKDYFVGLQGQGLSNTDKNEKYTKKGPGRRHLQGKQKYHPADAERSSFHPVVRAQRNHDDLYGNSNQAKSFES